MLRSVYSRMIFRPPQKVPKSYYWNRKLGWGTFSDVYKQQTANVFCLIILVGSCFHGRCLRLKWCYRHCIQAVIIVTLYTACTSCFYSALLFQANVVKSTIMVTAAAHYCTLHCTHANYTVVMPFSQLYSRHANYLHSCVGSTFADPVSHLWRSLLMLAMLLTLLTWHFPLQPESGALRVMLLGEIGKSKTSEYKWKFFWNSRGLCMGYTYTHVEVASFPVFISSFVFYSFFLTCK